METLELKPLIKPRRLTADLTTLTDTFGRFFAEPFERGFGITLGNSLRRVLLSSIQGAAATAVRFEGVRHEFTFVPGVAEDVNDIILNIKNVIFKVDGVHGPINIYIDKKGPGVVTAADFQIPEFLRVLNPDQLLATLSKDAHFRMELTVQQGRSYIPATYPKFEDEGDIGILPVDALFSPIKNVRYHVEEARVGQRTDYDRLIMEVTTNGAVRPDEAISYAARLLRDHLDLFIRSEDEGVPLEPFQEERPEETPLSEIEAKLDKSIEELELSVRSYNCLEAAGIKTIRDLVQKTESEMLKYRNFGRKSLSEIKGILKEMGLTFSMKLDERGIPIPSSEDKEEQTED